VEKLKKLGTQLGKYADCKIYYGIKPGRKAFLVDQATRDQLIAEDPRSAEVLKPFLRGRDIERYFIRPAGTWLIYTYHGIDISQYPAIEAYLEPYKANLEERATEQAWYELQQPQKAYQSGFEGPKIIYPDITPQADFSFDISGAYPDTTAFCIPTQASYLTAILNSKLLDFVLKHLSPIIRGGSYRYKREYVELLPIVEPYPEDQARLAALVDQLQALGGQGPQTEALEREVDAIVYRTYGLSKEEIAEIERWHAERRAQLGAGRRGQRIVVDEEIEEVEA
jgi:hypothetical protein